MRTPGEGTDPDRNLYQVRKTWYLKVQVNGHTVRESLRTTVLKEARAIRDQRLAELNGEYHSWIDTVLDWSANFLPTNVEPSTAKRYMVSIGQIDEAVVTQGARKALLKEMMIEQITAKTVSEIVAWRRKHVPGIKNATVRRDLTALSSVMSSAIANHWRIDNPATEWSRKAIKERRDPIVLPSDRDVDRLIATMPAMWQAALRLADATGMREMELFSLQHNDIEPNMSGVVLGKKTKRKRVRFVPFSEAAVGIVVGIPRHIKSRLVFWHDDGEPYRNVSSNFQQFRRRFAKDHPGDPVTFRFHDLRHRFAVNYLRTDGNIYDLQGILGHSSIKTTELYLDFLEPATRQRAIRRVGKSAQLSA
jgi:integrase/recombinase XerD